MKWKGRRQSTNVIVVPSDPIQRIIQQEAMQYGGGPTQEDLSKNETRTPGITDEDVKNAKVRKELGDRDRAGKNPVPTPNPRRGGGLYSTQVTPGKWTTKNKN